MSININSRSPPNIIVKNKLQKKFKTPKEKNERK